jgi:hypothetical protein
MNFNRSAFWAIKRSIVRLFSRLGLVVETVIESVRYLGELK